jgi:hypothetical protein
MHLVVHKRQPCGNVTVQDANLRSFGAASPAVVAVSKAGTTMHARDLHGSMQSSVPGHCRASAKKFKRHLEYDFRSYSAGCQLTGCHSR